MSSMKYCSRCYFAVNRKRHLCEICGSDSFLPESAMLPPQEEPSFAAEIGSALRQLWSEIKVEAVQSGKKAMRSSHKVVDLMRGHERVSEQSDERNLQSP